MRLLRAATLITPDPRTTAARYAEWFDYRLVEAGHIPDALAASWGAPGMAGRASCLCAPASGARIHLRFIEGTPPQAYRPLRSFGWAAIEICVQDVLAVHRRLLASPFDIIGPPRQLDGLPTIFPMQVRGPDQEIIFLTQIDGDLPDQDLPRAAAPIDALFILVLAASDMRVSLDWFVRHLKLDAGREIELAYSVLSNAFGLPAQHPHRIATLTNGRDVFLEVDQYPQGAEPRVQHPGELPPGVAMATIASPDFAALEGPWITKPKSHPGTLYGGRLAGTMVAPDGSLVEVIEV